MTDIAKENGADIVMYGHTHVPYLKKVFGVTVLNPGSISLPRQEDGKKSYAIMTVADDESVDFEICYHNEQQGIFDFLVRLRYINDLALLMKV